MQHLFGNPITKSDSAGEEGAEVFETRVVFYLLSNFGTSQVICLKYQCIEAYIRPACQTLSNALLISQKSNRVIADTMN